MKSISETFRELAQRFRDIEADTPNDAQVYLNRVCKDAIRTFVVACRDESFHRLFPS